MIDKPGFILIRAHYFLLNASLRVVAQVLYEKPHPADVKKLLLVRKGNLGDIVCSLPAFHAIMKHFSNATIDVLTTTGTQSAIGLNHVLAPEFFNEVITFDDFSKRDLFLKIRKGKYDAVIELPPDVDTWKNQLRNMLFFRLAGISSGFGWKVSNTLFLRKQQLKHLHFENEQQRLRSILAANGIVFEEDQYDGLFTDEDRNALLQKVEIGNQPGQLNVAVAVGAKLERKQWPVANFKKVVDDLLEKGMHVFLVGDEKDAALTASWSHDRLVNTCGKITIRESAALLSQCSFTLTNDSGPMHLSYAVGTPVLALFSARNYRGKWNPKEDGKNKMLVNYNVPCAICRDRVCGDNICMKAISPETVMEEIHTHFLSSR